MFSFRDPGGYLFSHKQKIYRGIVSNFKEQFLNFFNSPLYRKLSEGKHIPHSELVDEPEFDNPYLKKQGLSLFVEHEKIPFQSYPFEWSPQMLYQAGKFTLTLLEQALEHQYILKDATPYNILYKNTKPVFVDLLSFEPYTGNTTWMGYNQFYQTFFLPLLIYKLSKINPASCFITHRDGLKSEEAIKYFRGLSKFTPKVFFHIWLPFLLSTYAENKGVDYGKRESQSMDKSKYILSFLINRLKKDYQKLKPSLEKSKWSSYMNGHACSYTEGNFVQKKAFIEKALKLTTPAQVLDIGCNTGYFSKLAAKEGSQVVAIDFDSQVIGRLFEEAQEENLSILPIVIDFARPSPALGWNNQETRSFMERSEGYFDLVMMLAIIHHLIIQERIPLVEILKQIASVTKKHLILEYVGKNDPMFKKIARGRDHLYEGYNRESFENTLKSFFQVIEKCPLKDADRCLYFLKK